MSDKKYLFKRNNVWWVKLAVPLSLRSELGYDLRRTTGEKDLDKAIPIRDKIIEEFKTEFQIRKVNADDKGIVLRGTEHMQKTDISDPQYFHKVVDCQYACPAHTNVPEYIRLIAQKNTMMLTCLTGNLTYFQEYLEEHVIGHVNLHVVEENSR